MVTGFLPFGYSQGLNSVIEVDNASFRTTFYGKSLSETGTDAFSGYSFGIMGKYTPNYVPSMFKSSLETGMNTLMSNMLYEQIRD